MGLASRSPMFMLKLTYYNLKYLGYFTYNYQMNLGLVLVNADFLQGNSLELLPISIYTILFNKV